MDARRPLQRGRLAVAEMPDRVITENAPLNVFDANITAPRQLELCVLAVNTRMQTVNGDKPGSM